MADLHDVRINVPGATAAVKSVTYWRDLRIFWTDYFLQEAIMRPTRRYAICLPIQNVKGALCAEASLAIRTKVKPYNCLYYITNKLQ
jgi:hypothetical protein